MTTELDYGLGNLTAALRSAGMWESTVLILVSDNGGRPFLFFVCFVCRGFRKSRDVYHRSDDVICQDTLCCTFAPSDLT